MFRVSVSTTRELHSWRARRSYCLASVKIRAEWVSTQRSDVHLKFILPSLVSVPPTHPASSTEFFISLPFHSSCVFWPSSPYPTPELPTTMAQQSSPRPTPASTRTSWGLPETCNKSRTNRRPSTPHILPSQRVMSESATPEFRSPRSTNLLPTVSLIINKALLIKFKFYLCAQPLTPIMHQLLTVRTFSYLRRFNLWHKFSLFSCPSRLSPSQLRTCYRLPRTRCLSPRYFAQLYKPFPCLINFSILLQQ